MIYWRNLRENRCPKCRHLLDFNKVSAWCKRIGCGFRITLKKMAAITSAPELSLLRLKDELPSNDQIL